MTRLFTFLILLLTLVSCRKDNESIVGKWIWVESTGGIAGSKSTPESTGTRIKLKIDDTQIRRYTDGTLSGTWNYTIKDDVTAGQSYLIIEGFSWEYTYTVDADYLVMTEQCFDCYSITYKRK
jgi:hypothetical protein